MGVVREWFKTVINECLDERENRAAEEARMGQKYPDDVPDLERKAEGRDVKYEDGSHEILMEWLYGAEASMKQEEREDW